MIINKHWMYKDGGLCRMCDGSERDHTEGCPGEVIERFRYEITYSGGRCGRGCCGSVEGSASGETLEECAEQAAVDLEDTVDRWCEARLVFSLFEDVNKMVNDVMRRRNQEKAQKEEDRKRRSKEIEREAKLLDLEKMREDLTPQAYERRRTEIISQ